jgi:hypothetical protein
MKGFTKSALTVMVAILLSCGSKAQDGYEIEVKINGLKNVDIILGHYFNKQMVPDDTIRLNKNGSGVFQGEKALLGGMYLIYLPSKKYFDFIISSDQHFYIENDTSDFISNIKIKDSEENEVFFRYQKFIFEKNKKARELGQEKESLKDKPEEQKKISGQISKLNEEVLANMERIITENPDLFFASFLKATQEVEVPEEIPDSLKYEYYKSHFFDNFDITDGRLLRTPIYEAKIMKFIEKVIPPMPDSIIVYVDMLIEKSRSSDELFRFMLITLFNHYAGSPIMGMDAVYVHIAEKYYIKEAKWSSPEFIKELKEKVKQKKPNLIGKIAQNIRMLNVPYEHLVKSIEDSLVLKDYFYGDYLYMHEIEAKYTILYFWEADCSHCKVSTPKLYLCYNRLNDKGVKVMAINMLSGKEGKLKWAKFVKKHEFSDWINVWDPSYESQFKYKYDISSSPVLFLLDEKKEIIAKRISPEQAEEIIVERLFFDEIDGAKGEERIKIIKEFIKKFDDHESYKVLKKIIARHLDKDQKVEINKYLNKLIEKTKPDTEESAIPQQMYRLF